jgi:competence protein ComEA
MLKAFKNYFSVTKKQWNGLVVLMLLIVLVLASPYVYQLFYKNRAINLTGFDAAVAKLKNVTRPIVINCSWPRKIICF